MRRQTWTTEAVRAKDLAPGDVAYMKPFGENEEQWLVILEPPSDKLERGDVLLRVLVTYASTFGPTGMEVDAFALVPVQVANPEWGIADRIAEGHRAALGLDHVYVGTEGCEYVRSDGTLCSLGPLAHEPDPHTGRPSWR